MGLKHFWNSLKYSGKACVEQPKWFKFMLLMQDQVPCKLQTLKNLR